MRLSAGRWKATRLLSRAGFACYFAVTALATHAQTPDPLRTSVSIDAEMRPLDKVLKDIAAHAKVKFAYDADEIRKYNITLREKRQFTLEEVLKKVLAQTDLVFECHAHTIVIFNRDELKPADTGNNNTALYTRYTAPVQVITGTVMDDNGPLQNVTVTIRGTSIATQTNEKGEFRLDAPSGTATVLVSFVGYQTRELVIRSGSSNVIRLQHADLQLDKVVVVGYGTQKTSTVSGSVAQVSLDKISSRSVGSVEEVMQGKAPGVIVTSEGGDPTAAPSIYIRGLGGINGESVLYVVDGSIVQGSPVINPNEIESISVLKDATTAIYGARASGGVILITTKRGRKDESKVTLDAKFGSQAAWRKLYPLNAKQYADAINTAADNGIPQAPHLDAFNGAVYPDGQITRTNWVDDIFRHGQIQDYNASISGGNEKSNFYMGLGYRKAEGILLNTYTQRYTFRLNTDRQVNNWLKVGENMSFSSTNGNGAETQSDYYGALINAIFFPPSVAPYNADGTFAGLPAKYSGSYGDVINPVAYLKRLQVSNPYNRLTINPWAEVTLIPGLVFRSNFSYTPSLNYNKAFQTRVPEIGRKSDLNQLTQKVDNYSDLLAEQTLSFTRSFRGGHHLSAVGGYSYQNTKQDFLYVYTQGYTFEDPQYQYVQNGANILTGGNNTQSGQIQTALISGIGRINYDYQSKYLLTLIGRRDGTSLVAKQNRFKNYGSVSGGWVVSKEQFMQGIHWLSSLKLRGSYGVLGNLGSLPVTAVNAPMTQTINYFGVNTTQTVGYSANYLPSPNLDWARSKQLNLGLDIAVLKNRLSLTADYFVKNTENMLLLVQTPPTTGVTNGQYQNGGKAQDKGIELGLTYTSDVHNEFQYSVNANVTSVQNKLISLPGGQTNISTKDISNVRTILNPLYIHVGSPLYSYYVIRTAGIFQSQAEINNYTDKNGKLIQPKARPGDIKFVDANHDGAIDNNDRVVTAGAFPKFTYGFSFNASWKNFDLNIFAQGVYGNKIFNSLKFTAYNAGTGQNYNMLNNVLGAWTPTNTHTNIPILSSSDNNGNFSNTSDWYLESGSYLRIKNLTLGYTLPAMLTKRAGLGAIRFYVTSNNLLTFTKYTGFDPEIGMNYYGVDNGRYPQARSFMAGLNVNF